ncbi:MAG TPA: type II secretion system F family protein [bacterium]|nr:type II secretion system F family protein [bacterium]
MAFLALLSAALWAAGGQTDDDRAGGAARRLIRYLKRDAAHEGPPSAFARADRYVLRLSAGAALERRLTQAGVAAPVSALLLGTAVAASAVAGIAAALGRRDAGFLAVPVMVLAAHALLQAARGRRLRQLEAQLPGALDMLVGQLRAHRSIGEAVADVSRWLPEPLGGECARVAEELRIGVPLPRALERFRERVPAAAVPALVTTIAVADRTGANLTECLGRQAAAVRAQVAFRHEVSAMTAHARATGATLTFLPVGVAAAMLLLDPGVFAPMVGTVPGRALLGAAGLMELVGWQAVRWMIRRVEA